MSNASRPQTSALITFLQDRILPLITTLYLGIILLSVLAAPVFFFQSVRVPFMGAFVEHTLMLNTSQPTNPGAWELAGLGLPFGYQVVAVDGGQVEDIHHLNDTLGRYQPGDQIELATRSPDGDLEIFDIKLQSIPGIDQISYFVIPYLMGLIYLASGLYVFAIRRSQPVGRAFALFTASVAILLGGLFDLYTTNYLTYVWTTSLAVAGGALINLALLFPERTPLVARRPYLRWLGYGIAAVLLVIAWPTLYNLERPTAYVFAWRLEFIYLGLSAVFFLVMIAVRRYSAAFPIVREQARLIFWGALISFAPITVWLLVTTLLPSLRFHPVLLLLLGIFPITTGYAIIRYRLLSTDYVLSRTLLYALLTVLAVGGYALVVSGVSVVLGGVLQPTNPLVIGLMVFILALAFTPARSYLQRLIDTILFRGQVVYRERQQAFGRELTQAIELPEIVSLLRGYIDQALMPSQFHIYVFDGISAHYIALPDENGSVTSDVRFPADCTLVHALEKGSDSLFLADLDELPIAIQSEKARIALLAAQLFVALPGRQQLVGWIALGTRRSGEPYSSRDLGYLESLGSQVALAVERAQVVADLERRVREMNVLTRVAQGVSFTMVFDDILELISAQANQILPALDFRVTLYDSETDLMSHVFYLEDDERLRDRENRPLSFGKGLEEAVITSQRPLVTDDYERECHGRGLLPDFQGIYAWMGVPLNAGAQTIGVISIGSRDLAVTYTDEQRDLLQAIADQASGAIVKARLLEETEHRALQLATLNEIAIGVTSTLDLKPLLNRILHSAVEILNCEAGSLFLVDQETGEIVFEVVIGPVASDLLGRRLAPGTGLVGEAVDTGKGIIANDAKRRKEWHESTDEQTGFDTQDLLVIPMRMQDRVIGVIEVINKANGAPFTRADQDLLTAFTSQATIAIENARLYTMTDQALAARVEELSVMQRIDRELNASLEIDRAMRITLDWAMRQSNADAGFVGVIEEDGVSVMVAQGYSDELEGFLPPGDNGNYKVLPVDHLGLQEAIQSGLPQRLRASELPEGEEIGMLESARMQIAVPIRRETETIGLLLLESAQNEFCPDDLVNFLTRLSDHAAIAIANAQLYEEIKEANLAKSRFVSFVAHELKNPMASIKGYTELVAGGVAGPVSEMQSSFLSTVHSNVDRMNTIVSDLNDLTKIQVGNLRLEYKAVNIPDVLNDVVRSIQSQVEDKEQILELDLAQDLPEVWADASRMGQILTNLVSNAHKYTPQGGQITIGAQPSFAEASEEDQETGAVAVMHIWIKDSGIGISEEDQQKIFQQYFRTDLAKEMASGTGLGLNITKSLVEMQGGRIWFESAPGQGTTFHLTMPVAETE